MTYETASDIVELKQEVAYIKNLLELHRLRIQNPYEIVFIVDGYMKTGIAPAIFVPLIENAFKFASFNGEKPAIKISLISGCGIIIFNISNFFDKTSQTQDSNYPGSGLSSLKKRLELIYPGRYTLDISEENPIFSVKLTINTNTD